MLPQIKLIMTTITLQINEKSKKGKAFLEMARAFFEDSKDIQIVKTPNTVTQKAIDEAKKGKNTTKTKNHKDLMEKLLS